MNKKIWLSLISLQIIVSISYGQNNFRPGYLITLENDTIQGMVNYRSDSKNHYSCILKNGGISNNYNPNQILGFGFSNDKFFSSQIIEGTFVEVLVDGDISLYKSRNMYHVTKDTSFYNLESKKEEVEVDGKIGSKKTTKWKGILTYLINDCLQNPSSLTSNLVLEERSLTRLVIKYNKCTGNEFKEFKISKPWTQFDFGVTLGISRSQITTDGPGSFEFLDDSYSTIHPSIGVIVAVSSPRIIEQLAFQSEFHVLKSSYSSLVKIGTVSTRYHDTFIDLTTFSIPLSLKYSFSESLFGLYFQAGINYDHHISSETVLLSEQVNGGVVNTFPERSAFEINSNQIGYWGGIGTIKTYHNIKASIAIRYFQMLELNKTNGFSATNNRISLNLILFKK